MICKTSDIVTRKKISIYIFLIIFSVSELNINLLARYKNKKYKSYTISEIQNGLRNKCTIFMRTINFNLSFIVLSVVKQ